MCKRAPQTEAQRAALAGSYDAQGLRRELVRIDDMQTLGNAAFSQCRCITHWSMGPCERELDWLEIALGHLEELAHDA